METKNYGRSLVKILREIAEERDIDMTTFSHDWIIRLKNGTIVKYIFGYNFELNSATSQMIANDKSATSDLLLFNNIPHVEHKIFHHPRLENYVSESGNWARIVAFAQQHDFSVVCKPNDGTGGYGVFCIRTQRELERAVQQLFTARRSICLSPFYSIDHEYRVVVLNGEYELVYTKIRPSVTGDGISTIAELITKQASAGEITTTLALEAFGMHEGHLNNVLNVGERLELNWKHNLGQGAHPEIVKDKELLQRLGSLAVSCAEALNITFASVDVIEANGRLLVLEVNCGVMMESFIESVEDGYVIAKSIYEKAIDLMFKEPSF